MDIETAIFEIAKGNRRAFGDLYINQKNIMLRYATGILAGDVAAAEDVVDEGFFDIWRTATYFNGAGNAQGWIRRIMRNKAIDWLRKNGERSISSALEVTLEQTIDDADSPETAAIKSSGALALMQALDTLSADQREVIWLCYYEDKSIIEISELTDCPQNTVKTRLYAARNKLQDYIKSKGDKFDMTNVLNVGFGSK